MQKTCLLSIVAGYLVAVMLGCSQQESTGSRLSHDLGQPTRSNDTWAWQQVKDDSTLNALLPYVGYSSQDLLQKDHVANKRLQAWLDFLYDSVESTDERTLVAPRPTVRVVASRNARATMLNFPACFTHKAKINVAADKRRPKAAVWNLPTNNLLPYDQRLLNCAKEQPSKMVLDEIATTANDASSKDGCHIRNEKTDDGDSVLVTEGNCATTDEEGTIIEVNHVVVFRASGYIIVSTGMIEEHSEEAIVAILAHELAHHLRSHGTRLPNEYDFFYRLDPENPLRKPSPDPLLAELGARAFSSARFLSSFEKIQLVDESSVDPALSLAMISMLNKSCTATSCPPACREAKAFVDSRDFDRQTRGFPMRYTSGVEATYRRLEAYAERCFDDIKFEELAIAEQYWQDIRDYLRKPRWPRWLLANRVQKNRILGEFAVISDALKETKFDGNELSVWDLFKTANKKLLEQYHLAKDNLLEANSAKLGFYTIEQEADELSVEWLHQAGLDASAAIDSTLVNARLLSKLDTVAGEKVTDEGCRDLMKAGWLDANGLKIEMGLGDYYSPYHGFCFRAYNLSQEISMLRAQQHSKLRLSKPKFQTDWTDIQDSLRWDYLPRKRDSDFVSEDFVSDYADYANASCPYDAGNRHTDR